MYADDTAITMEELNVDIINNKNLVINPQKTKCTILSCNRRSHTSNYRSLSIAGRSIPKVAHFRFHGRCIYKNYQSRAKSFCFEAHE